MDSLEMLASGGLGDGHETPILASNKAGPHPRSLRSSNVSQYMQMPAGHASPYHTHKLALVHHTH